MAGPVPYGLLWAGDHLLLDSSRSVPVSCTRWRSLSRRPRPARKPSASGNDLAGAAEWAGVLIRSGPDPDAKEAQGHTLLDRALTGGVARLLLAAGPTADSASGPTGGRRFTQPHAGATFR
jgi:hypothetical protein